MYQANFKRLVNSLINVGNSRYLISLRESFIALLPVLISLALLSLINVILTWYNSPDSSSTLYLSVNYTSATLITILPGITAISIGYHLSKNLSEKSIAGSILSLICFIIHSKFLIFTNGALTINPNSINIYAIIIPSITCYLLHWITKSAWFNRVQISDVSHFLSNQLKLITPFIIIFLSLFIIIPIIEVSFSKLFQPLLSGIAEYSVVTKMYLRSLAIHVGWFIGIHGDNALNLSIGQSLVNEMILPGLTAKSFYNAFVLLGGSGAFWGLIAASFFIKKTSHHARVARLSIPFTTFNFSEVIIYGMTIVFNPLLFIPFILVPSFNFFVSYYILGSGLFTYVDQDLSWMTPIFISGWLTGNGIALPIFQLFLVVCNAAIYYPFLLISSKQYDDALLVDKLQSKLRVKNYFQKDSEKNFVVAQHSKNKQSKKLLKTIEWLNTGKLLLHYQPKLCVQSQKIEGFEALLRFKDDQGKLHGPAFLNDFIASEQNEVFDKWVIQQVAKDISFWHAQNFYFTASVNLSPDALLNDVFVEKICQEFASCAESISIEIVESSLIKDVDKVIANIQRLKTAGIKVILDDFGTGYSSLSLLSKLPVDQIKLDRTFLGQCSSEKGQALYQSTVKLLHELDFRIVAEGVETEEELAFISQLNIEFVQGWYYAKAMSKQDVIEYINSNANLDT